MSADAQVVGVLSHDGGPSLARRARVLRARASVWIRATVAWAPCEKEPIQCGAHCPDRDAAVTLARAEPITDEDTFVVELDRFRGPLDLLLHLIREQDIDIFDIPIAQITEQFLAAIEGVEALGLDVAGEFLETAAMLVRIKAQMVLPRRLGEESEGEDPRAELVRRLLEYEHFREASLRLAQAEQVRLAQFARGFVPPRQTEVVVSELLVTWDEVMRAAIDMRDRVHEFHEHRIQPRPVPVEEKIGLIARTLSQLGRIEFTQLVAPFGDRLHTAVTLLAGLEMARQRRLTMRQRAPFTSLWLYRRKEDSPDAGDADR